MVRTLAALEQLPTGSTLLQELNVRVPRFLLPKLGELGFTYEVREQSDELVRIFTAGATGNAPVPGRAHMAHPLLILILADADASGSRGPHPPRLGSPPLPHVGKRTWEEGPGVRPKFSPSPSWERGPGGEGKEAASAP